MHQVTYSPLYDGTGTGKRCSATSTTNVVPRCRATHHGNHPLSGLRRTTLISQILTLEEAAKACGVSRRTLYGWRKQGIGPRSFIVGERRIVYRVSDINAYLERRIAETGRGGL